MSVACDVFAYCLTFCFRHDAHALTLRDTTGTDASIFPFDNRGREAGDADFASPSIWDQVRLGGIMRVSPHTKNLDGDGDRSK